MVKPLVFKGDKKIKKRKHRGKESSEDARKKQALIAASSEEVADDDTWVSAEGLDDVAGPVMLVLPSATATSLASDAHGKVFAMPIENIVDGNPSSAEPHDVRQVWVANKIVGTDHFRFKGHHGKFLGCDKYGLLSATAIAVSPLESFVLAVNEGTPGTFQIKTLHDTYLSVQEPKTSAKAVAVPEIRGDATETNLNTAVRIRMQARFKPKIQASKEERAREKISRRELEDAVGRRLEDDDVKMLKKARREGDYHEKLLNVKSKYKHDKYV